MDSKKEFQTIHSVKMEEDGRQTAILRVASEDGGFIVPAQTPSEKGDKLQPGDIVLWVPQLYKKDIAEGFGDERAGWVGFIMAKVSPEIDFEKADFQIICEYG